MSWYYYTCMYGPGHQGESDGFREMPDGMSDKDVAEELIEDFRDYDWPIIHVWKITQPPTKYLKREVDSLESKIKYATERLEQIKKMGDGAGVFSEPGEDAEISKAISNTVRHSLIEHLHKKGVIVTSGTVNKWRGYYSTPPTEKPMKQYRTKVLNAIKACDKYPDYKKA